jgi:peptide/nickel transport system permease protein
MREWFGLDKPLYIQFFQWIRDTLRGDLGTSWRNNQPVLGLILERLPLTLELTFLAMVITIVIGVPAGVISAARKDTLLDHAGRIVSFTSLGLPNFWQGAMMILFFSKVMNWMPPMRYVGLFRDPVANLKMLGLPAITMGTVNVANVMRLTRSSMLEVLSQDYIRTARAKGLTERVVIFKHALRNSLISVVTVAGMMAGYLLGGAVVVESVFNLPGMGRLVLYSIYQRDYPVTQGVLLFTCTLFILMNFLVDILYSFIDPKIRYT